MEIKDNTKPDEIIKYFRKCKINDSVNYKTSSGYIYLVGGILSKLQGNDHYIAIKGFWRKV